MEKKNSLHEVKRHSTRFVRRSVILHHMQLRFPSGHAVYQWYYPLRLASYTDRAPFVSHDKHGPFKPKNKPQIIRPNLWVFPETHVISYASSTLRASLAWEKFNFEKFDESTDLYHNPVDSMPAINNPRLTRSENSYSIFLL